MKKVPPGPPSRFFGLNQIPMFYPERLVNTFEECFATYGDVVRVSLAGIQQTLIFHPDYVHQLLLDEPEKITRSALQQRSLGVFHGNSLTNSDGDFWKRQRKLMQPAFHSQRIQRYMDTMAEKTGATLDRWQSGRTYDVANEMTTLTRAVVGETLFGTDVSIAADRIEWAIELLQNYATRKGMALLPLPIWIPTPFHRQAQHAIDDLRSLVTGLIESRRASGEDRGDLLSMLLLAVDDGENGGGSMSNLQARDEAISTLIVGHVTTASALSWIFAEIAWHPEVEAKIRAELDEVLGGRAPTMQDVRKLKYLDMVIKETLRIHPPSLAMARDVVQDIEIGEYLIPKGSGILFSQHVMQRDPRWFPEPQRYMPERFADGWENKVPKCAYMPFGTGPHNCIGQIFATMEMNVILAMVMQRYRMVLEPGQEIVPGNILNQHPRDGVKMRVELREPVTVTA